MITSAQQRNTNSTENRLTSIIALDYLHVLRLLVGLMIVAPSVAIASELFRFGGSQASGSEFASALDTDQNLVIVGAPGELNRQGRAYIYSCSLAQCGSQIFLQSNIGAGAHEFGHAVAIQADTAVVAAPGANIDAGAAFTFVRDMLGNWGDANSLITTSILTSSDRFGHALALDANTLAVAAIGDANSRGAVYVFVRNGLSWNQQAKLIANDGASGDQFGYSLALQGDLLAIGAPFEADSPNYAQGAVYFFERQANVWTFQSKLSANSPANGQLFGHSLAMQNNRLAIGLPFRNADTGMVQTFERAGNNWNLTQTINPEFVVSSKKFGWDVSINANHLIVSAAFAGSEAGNHCGAMSSYQLDLGQWQSLGFTQTRLSQVGDLSGWKVAAFGVNGWIAGAPGKNANTGSAFWFNPIELVFENAFELNPDCELL